MDEILEVIAFIRALKFLRDELVGKPGDFGGAAIALGSLQTHDRHACRGRCSPPCPSCDEQVILGVADAEIGL